MPSGGASAAAVPHGLVEFLRGKDRLKGFEAVLCIAHWLTEQSNATSGSAPPTEHGEAGASIVVTAAEVRATYPYGALPDVLPRRPDIAEAMSAADARLLERVEGTGRASYRVTPLGHQVALALPDRRLVGALRQLQRTASRRGGPPRWRAEQP